MIIAACSFDRRLALTPGHAAQGKNPESEKRAPTFKTGPEPGQRIPPFEAPDQNGTLRTFESLRGPKGALLVFFRSADW